MNTVTPKPVVKNQSVENRVKETKEKLVSRPSTITPPRKKAFTLNEPEVDYAKLLFFGPTGSGKTYTFGQLAALGYKVAIMTTDIGDTGHLTIKAYLKSIGKSELLKNVLIIPLEDYKEVTTFLKAPEKVVEGIYEFDPDFLGWDGFHGFQQVHLSEYVGEMTGARDKDRGDFRESGLVLEMQDWGAIRNATIRVTNDYFRLHNRLTGKRWHKIMTCAEQLTQKQMADRLGNAIVVEAHRPALQGMGGQMLLGGFDLILKTKVKVTKADDGAQREYLYIAEGSENLIAKKRGINIPPQIPADMSYVWAKVQEILSPEEKIISEEDLDQE
jgi:hypothetical protein